MREMLKNEFFPGSLKLLTPFISRISSHAFFSHAFQEDFREYSA